MKQLAIPLCAVKHALSGWLLGLPCFLRLRIAITPACRYIA